MDDLISRKAVAEKMKNRRDYVGRPSDPDCIIADEPSVPAVPLDKLCEWLAGNAWHLDCSDCDAEHCDCPQWHDDSGSSPAFWKAKLTKWMEEQNENK